MPRFAWKGGLYTARLKFVLKTDSRRAVFLYGVPGRTRPVLDPGPHRPPGKLPPGDRGGKHHVGGKRCAAPLEVLARGPRRPPQRRGARQDRETFAGSWRE